ncbi:MAG: hypothetical protein ACAH59_05345, partial [Pseudobdellovibrionaceae bacterium]
TRMAISQDGSVGIGTNKPVSFVQIAYPGMISAINNANTYLQIGGDESTSNGHRLIGFGYTTPSNTYSPAYMGYQESSSAGQSKGDLIFGTRSTTSDAQPEERMRIMSSGNVGIGTNAPGTSLDVSGAITVRPTGTASGNTGQILLRELSVNGTNTVTLRAPDALAADVSFALPSGDGSSGQVLSTNGLGVLTWIDAGSSNGFVDGGNSFGQAGDLGTNDNNPLYLRTNSNTKMTILAAGNIGIGTTNPTYSLSFSGDSSRTIGMERHSTAGTAGSDLILAAGGATSGSSNKDGGGLQLKAGTATGNGGSNISFYVAQGNQGPGTTDRLADIFMGGIDGTTRSVRLGIGSSAAGNYSTALGYSASAQGNYSVAVGPNFYVSGTNSMGFNLDTTNRTLSQDSTMAIMGGNVGIGTTIPGSGTKLNVDGQIRSKSASIATGSVDWSAGNTVTTSFDCGSQISMANIRDGGSYTLVVTGTGTTQCDFNTATTGDDAGTVTYRFSPPNSTRSASTHTIYSLLRVGTIVYISWIGGF